MANSERLTREARVWEPVDGVELGEASSPTRLSWHDALWIGLIVLEIGMVLLTLFLGLTRGLAS